MSQRMFDPPEKELDAILDHIYKNQKNLSSYYDTLNTYFSQIREYKMLQKTEWRSFLAILPFLLAAIMLEGKKLECDSLVALGERNRLEFRDNFQCGTVETLFYGMTSIAVLIFLAWQFSKNSRAGYKINPPSTPLEKEEKPSYTAKYNLAEKKLTELENKFQSLTNDQKAKLCSEYKLAEKDGVEEIYLKFVCPISKSLIIQPVEITARLKDGTMTHEIYEHRDLYTYLVNQQNHGTAPELSPLSRLPIEKCGFSQDLNKEHCQYLQALGQAMDKLLLENTVQYKSIIKFTRE